MCSYLFGILIIMKPETKGIITPKPFYKISFRCSNRLFCEVKNEVYQIGRDIGIDPEDGYITESCDYEGDLDTIRVYRGDRSGPYIAAILDKYDVTDSIPEDMDVVLSIF